MILIGLFLWIVLGHTLLCRLDNKKNIIFHFCISFFATITMLSILFCLALFAKITFTAFQIIFLVIPLLLLIYNRKKISSTFVFKQEITTKDLVILLTSIVGFSVIFFILTKRWGDWDAWAIWTNHAKFLISEDYFKNVFSNHVSWSHPDYPLFLPALIASIWKSLATTSALIPVFIAYTTSLLLVITIYTSLKALKFNHISNIVIVILCFSNLMFPFASSQYSDTLLSAFIVLSLVLINHLAPTNFKYYLFLIGFFVASSGWIKNEGIIYFIIFSLLFTIHYWAKRKQLKFYFLGAVIPMLFIVFYKIKYAPENDLITESNTSVFQYLFNLDRYITIFKYGFKIMISEFFVITVFLIIAIIFVPKYYKSFAFKVLISLFIVYFFVYVVTPKNLDWHLKTSFSRLLHHIFPALTYTLAVAFGKKLAHKYAKH